MSEKIEMFSGWDWDGTLIVGSKRNTYVNDECTVVVHDDKSERVYTESEVRAILLDVFRSRSHFEFSGGLSGMLIQPGDIERIAKHHGIVLDPA